ncbi:G-protein coupled receptor, putative [Plasmodium vivax]|uniref:G-protein coupled receptor, putative n=6 Tax=Plasmodium vivax TaxID=5855 RepID=A5K9A4_PLAVS|nr:G-protein coupled receptor, putative [Plasmodium vivax]KMZ80117.1 G-protein coupled receptor [Plasmodium vivax India VII]KMZ86203.1 G-protein coupled receptor [Plasmodium vivax Brazil I]KMZ92564.1 G-protein coupled receptor [Plasmodium vivax Mauritania I]KMZ99114.1 G-protein coupled receptor [Plasmodium vivax North Korean]EDL43976.1 G-protein coupled receptor, putative [Plasmodium vivax]|eukprot:XP_001613703.1 G-protein coupled receptor [Plasmodium vivax Sal-1]
MEGSGRYISNAYLEEFTESDSDEQTIRRKINEYAFKLNNEMERHSSQSIYCGLGGILYMDIILYESSDDYTFLQFGNNIVKRINSYRGKDTVSFLEGPSGLYSLASVLHYYLENHSSVDTYIQFLVTYLRDKKEELVSMSGECELLYGKCGCMYSFLFCRNIWIKSDHRHTILQSLYIIMTSIFEYGLLKGSTMWNVTSLSLYFEWHEQIYLGAAHGYAGIFLVLYKMIMFFHHNLKELCEALLGVDSIAIPEVDEAKYKRCRSNTMEKLNEYLFLIFQVTDEIMNLYLTEDCNVYSSIKKNKSQKKNDTLVQWCHGNVGFVILIIELLKCPFAPNYFVNKYSKRYLEKMGLLIWERGLLFKGMGLCHGIAGNGIAFLYLYKHTGERRWYIKALKYALFCIKYFDRFYGVPDRPNSLFEGYAGLVVFLNFVLRPDSTYFPAYDTPPDLPPMLRSLDWDSGAPFNVLPSA